MGKLELGPGFQGATTHGLASRGDPELAGFLPQPCPRPGRTGSGTSSQSWGLGVWPGFRFLAHPHVSPAWCARSFWAQLCEWYQRQCALFQLSVQMLKRLRRCPFRGSPAQATAVATAGFVQPSPAPCGLLGDQQVLWGSVAAASGLSLSCPGPLAVLPPDLWALPLAPFGWAMWLGGRDGGRVGERRLYCKHAEQLSVNTCPCLPAAESEVHWG